jgi:KUP system potassium uptake protein
MERRGVSYRLTDLFPDFVRTKNYDTLSGVLLAVTGCEALFAKYIPHFLFSATCLVHPFAVHSLGQFNMLSIQVGRRAVL